MESSSQGVPELHTMSEGQIIESPPLHPVPKTSREQVRQLQPDLLSSAEPLASDEVTVPQCEQCAENSQMVDATGFCTECSDYLCSSCVQQHQTLRVSRTHTVLTGQDMPNSSSLQCPQHPGQSVLLYCPSENTFGCDICFRARHKLCNYGLISDLCKDVETSDELNEILIASKRHSENVDLYAKLIGEYRVLNENCSDRALEEFQSFRTDIEATLNQLGETVATEAGQLKDTNKKKLDLLLESATSLSKVMSDINLRQKTKQKEQLFIAVKMNMTQIKETEEKLVKLNKEVPTQVYEFEAERAVNKIVGKKTSNGGVLKVFSGDIQCTGTINIHSPDDEGECYVDGVVEISPDEIAVIDYRSTCLKKISLANNVICKWNLKAFAFDIAIIPESRLALTLPYLHQLHFFSTENTLEPCGIVEVDGECVAIVSTEDRLVVSFRDPPMVQIMDFEGRVQQTITSDASGAAMFDFPRWLTIGPKKTTIYISDRWKKNVTSMSIDGNFQWAYADDQLFPEGVAIDGNGLLYVCSRDTHTIHVVSPAGVCLRIIPVTQFQLEFPKAIHYSRCKGLLYVSSQSADIDKVNYIRQLSLQ